MAEIVNHPDDVHLTEFANWVFSLDAARQRSNGDKVYTISKVATSPVECKAQAQSAAQFV